jgi:high-affinity K+ transport system ATPase subunit B
MFIGFLNISELSKLVMDYSVKNELIDACKFDSLIVDIVQVDIAEELPSEGNIYMLKLERHNIIAQGGKSIEKVGIAITCSHSSFDDFIFDRKFVI